ncbi:phage tail protein [Azotobacter chroococcum]|uniref:phage tail-collar fiber domain-containing protein n=1 Tax=Azotobacter chroococcum TaxID=353 RepID=UPI0010AE3E71|nr:phage tail protein [Azotobacter chroococcum]TKD40703.1 phage tail protein [Azotobacter chroococcum]
MTLRTIHTAYGLSRLVAAEITNEPVRLTHMAVGDGNGNPTDPDEAQTQLVRERYRAAVNRVYPSPSDLRRFTAEMVIPVGVGGFTLREVGVFDETGALFLVGNLPETYKPTQALDEAFADTIVRVEFVVGNAEVITLQVDPNIAVASQTWVINNITAATLIPGGTVGQLLGKSSNADGDYQWQNPDAISVTVDTVAEKQLLAAGQTVVDLALTTTYGLAVYIDGLRLDLGSGAGEWQPDGSLETRLHLGQSYPAGTRITLVQNEPAGSAGAPLERSQNLADVLDKAASRDNLEVYSKAEVNQRVRQPGDIYHTAAATPGPFGLKANGAAVSRTVYAALFARIGTRFGSGDGFTTFTLPDLRGEFVRGWDDGRGVDGGRELGSAQGGATQSHTHSGSVTTAGKHTHTGKTTNNGRHSHSVTFKRDRSPVDPGNAVLGDEDYYGEKTHTTTENGDHFHGLSIAEAGEHSHGLTIGTTGGSETRPRNVALLACIAF